MTIGFLKLSIMSTKRKDLESKIFALQRSKFSKVKEKLHCNIKKRLIYCHPPPRKTNDQIKLTFIEYLLCANHCVRYTLCIILMNPGINPKMLI